MVRIVVNGIGGRMGGEVARAAMEDTAVSIVGGFESPRSPLIGKSLRALFGDNAPDVKVTAQDRGVLETAECAIDFSVPSSTASLLRLARGVRTALVIGTTGLGPDEMEAVRELSESHAILLSSNLSEGMNAVFELLPGLLAALGGGWDVEVVERHHRRKIDAPSGTALRIGEIVSAGLGRPLGAVARFGRSGRAGPRGEGEIGFHSVRGGEIPGEHSVILGKGQEEIVITHRVFGRAPFARGALEGAKLLAGKDAGLRTTLAELVTHTKGTAR